MEFELPEEAEGAVGRLDDLGRLGNTFYVLEMRRGTFSEWPVYWRAMVDPSGFTYVDLRTFGHFKMWCIIDPEASVQPGQVIGTWQHGFGNCLLEVVYDPLDYPTGIHEVPAYTGNLYWDDDHVLHPFVD